MIPLRHKQVTWRPVLPRLDVFPPKAQNAIRPPATHSPLICICFWRMSWFLEFTFFFSLEICLPWITLNAFPQKVQIIEPIGAQGKEFQFRTKKQRCSRVNKKRKWRRRSKVWQSRVQSKVSIWIYWKTTLKDEQRSAQKVFLTGEVCFCWTFHQIQQERREQKHHTDWLEFIKQRQDKAIFGNQLCTSQGQTYIHSETQTRISWWSHSARFDDKHPTN